MDEQTTLKDWLQALYDQQRVLTPEIVREAARPPDSPAHRFVFNVPPGEAAERYYLAQAQRLIRYVVVPKPTDDEPARTVRLFHAVPGEPGEPASYVYLSNDDLQRRPARFEAAKSEALRRLRDAQDAVEDLDLIVADTPMAPQAKRARAAVREAVGALVSPS